MLQQSIVQLTNSKAGTESLHSGAPGQRRCVQSLTVRKIWLSWQLNCERKVLSGVRNLFHLSYLTVVVPRAMYKKNLLKLRLVRCPQKIFLYIFRFFCVIFVAQPPLHAGNLPRYWQSFPWAGKEPESNPVRCATILGFSPQKILLTAADLFQNSMAKYVAASVRKKKKIKICCPPGKWKIQIY